MADVPGWSVPSEDLRIEPNELHVWRARDGAAVHDAGRLCSLLDAKERARANQFKFESDRNRFIVTRGILRRLLARYSGRPNDAIQFRYGRYGKPSLIEGSSDAEHAQIYFNVSHTKGLALFAFSATTQVGIDVEAVDSARDWESIAARFFHSREVAFMDTLQGSDRTRAAYDLWTCKEAYLKACGDGIGGGLDSFEVILPTPSDKDPRIELEEGSATDAPFLRSLDVGDGFSAAVAALARPTRVWAWDFPPL